VQDVFNKNPQFTLDYFSICDETHLQEIKNPIGGIPRGFIAAKLGNIRLIDNLSF
jgi:pantothenate synthetase